MGVELLTFMFTVHQLSLKSVEEKSENTAECCLQKTKQQQQQQNKTNKQTKKKQRSGRFTRIKT